MRLTFLGVRGSTAAPGADFSRYGGHTSCIAVSPAPGSEPVLMLDAGTGLRSATGLLAGPFRGTILISHLHWDHVQGIPFFAAGDREGAAVHVVVPAQDGRTGLDLLTDQMSPPSFPITPAGLVGDWSFEAAEPGPVSVPGFEVVAMEVEHKGGRTYGYRLSQGGASIAYVPDHAPAVGVGDDVLEAIADVDVLIHDAQFLEHERPRARDYGHCTVQDAIGLAERTGARSLVLFHHSPGRTDEAVDAILADARCWTDLPVTAAAEGSVLDL
jgi:phosphoribosyl 1,2-cyclic phosphodiesterase